MAQALKQMHKGVSKPPQYLFAVPHATGRKTVSGAEIYEPDWFTVEAARGKEPAHIGETRAERDARLERYATYGLAVTILAAVGFAVALAVF